MVAVPEVAAFAPTADGVVARSPLAHCQRVVAVVDTTVELLRPESDLLRVVSGIGRVDVLVALADEPAAAPGPVGVLDPDRVGAPDGPGDVVDPADEPDDDEDTFRAEIRAEIERLAVPGLRVHHLGLRGPLSPLAEPDLIAALSELVGFDPEPGVYCLAPAPAAGAGDLGRAVVGAAARRIAQVYGLPLLRYRCLELAVVPGQRSGTDR